MLSHDSSDFELIIRQQPDRARVAGGKEKGMSLFCSFIPEVRPASAVRLSASGRLVAWAPTQTRGVERRADEELLCRAQTYRPAPDRSAQGAGRNIVSSTVSVACE